MYCRNCGFEVSSDARFCGMCGSSCQQSPHLSIWLSRITVILCDLILVTSFIYALGIASVYKLPVVNKDALGLLEDQMEAVEDTYMHGSSDLGQYVSNSYRMLLETFDSFKANPSLSNYETFFHCYDSFARDFSYETYDGSLLIFEVNDMDIGLIVAFSFIFAVLWFIICSFIFTKKSRSLSFVPFIMPVLFCLLYSGVVFALLIIVPYVIWEIVRRK